jgi:hypothetical protein
VSQDKQLALALSLKRVAPFSELALAMLFVIAGAAARRVYEPGAEILLSGLVPDEVHIPIIGHVACGGQPITHAFDIPGVAFDRLLAHSYVAAEAGCTTASITRSHVFTLLRECPELSLAVARLPNAGTVAQ